MGCIVGIMSQSVTCPVSSNHYIIRRPTFLNCKHSVWHQLLFQSRSLGARGLKALWPITETNCTWLHIIVMVYSAGHPSLVYALSLLYSMCAKCSRAWGRDVTTKSNSYPTINYCWVNQFPFPNVPPKTLVLSAFSILTLQNKTF